MSKIIVFLAIVALACVNNAQNIPNPYAMAQAGTGFFGFPSFPIMFFPKMMSPEDIMNMKTGPNQNSDAVYMASNSKDGKTITTLVRNKNGVKTVTVLP